MRAATSSFICAANAVTIDHAAVVGFEILNRIADGGCGGGVRAMSGVGDQNFLARVPFDWW